MINAQPLDPESFAAIVRSTPLVSIDLIVQNEMGEVLLGKRKNAPAQGYWFVPGGRILKDEPLQVALARILQVELGVGADSAEISLVGVFDHIYDENIFQDPAYGTHYVVLAHRIVLALTPSWFPEDQHTEYQWWDINSLLQAEDVHPYTQAYFRSADEI